MVPVSGPARRVVSLVPSLTESVALTRPGALVGATDWCTHPTGLTVARVRGTKNPDLARIVDLAPDLVIANKEENRQLDVRRLREAGVPVWVTVIETVPQAIDSLTRLFTDGLRWGVPAWLAKVRATWDRPVPPARARVAVPIWRDPWMVVGRDTFTGDLLRRRGYRNVFAQTLGLDRDLAGGQQRDSLGWPDIGAWGCPANGLPRVPLRGDSYHRLEDRARRG